MVHGAGFSFWRLPEAAQGGTGVVTGRASTPHYTIAMITHAGPGQTFWDIERYGGVAAATKARAAGIPVTMFNAGSANWRQCQPTRHPDRAASALEDPVVHLADFAHRMLFPPAAGLLEREAASGQPAGELLRRLVQAVLDHQAGGLRDDATLLLVQ